MDAGLQVSGLVRNQHQFCSCRIVLTPKSFFLRPKTRHRPHQSYDAFPSQSRDQCFTRLAKIRRNTVTYWTTAGFANRETCSFIWLNDAFRKTERSLKKNKNCQVLNKPQMRLLLKISGSTFYQIQTDIYIIWLHDGH